MDRVIEAVDVNKLEPFPNSPFSVNDERDISLLMQSVKDFGIMNPIICRPIKEGEAFEIISGHRRWEVAKLLGMSKVPAYVKEMTKDEATIMMVDSNLHREFLYPSEKAFAYRMKLEAMKHQGFRSDLTSTHVEQKLTSVETLANKSQDSRSQIQRYIRLTYLIEPLLKLVDESKIALTPAVELSYLNEFEQEDLNETIESEDCTPSLSQAKRMRKLSEEGCLDMDEIFNIMTEEKGNQKEVLKVPMDKIKKYLNPMATRREQEDFIVKACDHYTKYLQRVKNSREER